MNIDQALDARDAFAKALYSSLFSWLVARVNHIVYKGTKQTAAISILDIFGFENFTENSLEQLCINYANENLQFYFNKHIFKLEQQEYAKEKIDWTTINYTVSESPLLDLIGFIIFFFSLYNRIVVEITRLKLILAIMINHPLFFFFVDL